MRRIFLKQVAEYWVKRFPDTEVAFASRLLIEQREHGRGEHNEMGNESAGFQETANMQDTRLARNTLVFGVTRLQGDKAVAFSLESLEKQEDVLKFRFDDQAYLIKKISEFSVVAFRLEDEQADRTYHVSSEIPFRLEDDQGGLWDEFGRASNVRAEDLLVADGYLTEWYEWVSSYPQSD